MSAVSKRQYWNLQNIKDFFLIPSSIWCKAPPPTQYEFKYKIYTLHNLFFLHIIYILHKIYIYTNFPILYIFLIVTQYVSYRFQFGLTNNLSSNRFIKIFFLLPCLNLRQDIVYIICCIIIYLLYCFVLLVLSSIVSQLLYCSVIFITSYFYFIKFSTIMQQ